MNLVYVPIVLRISCFLVVFFLLVVYFITVIVIVAVTVFLVSHFISSVRTFSIAHQIEIEWSIRVILSLGNVHMFSWCECVPLKLITFLSIIDRKFNFTINKFSFSFSFWLFYKREVPDKRPTDNEISEKKVNITKHSHSNECIEVQLIHNR